MVYMITGNTEITEEHGDNGEAVQLIEYILET